MIDRRNVFDKPVKDNLITYDNIQKITIGQEITQPFVYEIIPTLKVIIRQQQ